MEEKDKQLLLKDLCARLPYGVMLNTPTGTKKLLAITTSFEYKTLIVWEDYCGNEHNINEWLGGDVEFVKPFLRPMSSMTEEEKKEFIHYASYDIEESVNGRHYEYYLHDGVGTPEEPTCNFDAIDWLNAHHFDYRGLIPKGLALEALKNMYRI